MPDSAPEFGAGPGAGPKNFEILKFGILTDFNVLSGIKYFSVKFG